MEERDVLSFGTYSRLLVNEADPRCSAALKRSRKVFDGEANMVNAWPTFGDELCDWRVRLGRLEQFDERLAGRETRNAGAVRVVERDDVHS